MTRSIIGLRSAALELDLALAEIGLDAVELAEEIVVPEGAAEFAVGRMDFSPISSCFLMIASISRSSMALSCAAVISFFSCLARASFSGAVRNRLPT